MPLQVARLRKSKAWLICKRRPELAFYMINLWSAAWHEKPAGSLEDDDDVLADLAMCPPNEWPKLRADVLRGWTKCGDGRLYHPVVVEVAVGAWKSKLQVRYERECDRLRKENRKRKDESKQPIDIPDFDDWNFSRNSSRKTNVSAGMPRNSTGKHTESTRTSQGIPPENALKVREVKVREVKGEEHTLRAGGVPPESISTGKPPDGNPPDPGDGPQDAWRDITECDPQAYESWIAWRLDEYDVIPPRVRIQDAKFLSSKGPPEEQRAFVDELIRRRFKRLHDPTVYGANGNANGRKPYVPAKTTAELEDEAIARGIAEGRTDQDIACDIDVDINRVRTAREQVAC